jgi:hypothetical protein
VDFIVRAGKLITAIEVRSGRRRESIAGVGDFTARFKPARSLLVGQGGLSVEDFLERPATYWVT